VASEDIFRPSAAAIVAELSVYIFSFGSDPSRILAEREISPHVTSGKLSEHLMHVLSMGQRLDRNIHLYASIEGKVKKYGKPQ
jgi:hypothetical protein